MTIVRLTSTALTLAALAACTPGTLGDRTFATGSSTLASSSDHRAVYAVNVDEDTISVVRDGVVVEEVFVGDEPTRIARAGDQVYASLRGQRAIAVLVETGSGLQLIDRIDVGAEPFGLVASERGDRVWAAISQADEVVEIDTASREVTHRWAIAGEPRWLALHPSEQGLFVATAYPTAELGPLMRVDLDTGAIENVPMPVTQRASLQVDVRLPRVTGDIAVSPDGRWLGVPVLFVDNVTPLGDSFGGIGTGLEYYGGERNEPGVALFSTTPQGGVWVVQSSAVLSRGTLDGSSVGSYPSSVTFSPDSDHMLVTAETSDVVSTIYIPRRSTMFDGFDDHKRVLSRTGRGPRGVAFTDADEAFVHTFIERGVAELDYIDAARTAQAQGSGNFFSAVDNEGPAAEAPTIVTTSALPFEVEEGRKMFFSSVDRRMAGEGQGISCSTCHFDGRNDGITWPFADMPRNTPSLAGAVSRTAPVTWTDDVQTVAEEAQLTAGSRMGGAGLNDEESAMVAAFIDYGRHVDRAERGLLTDEVALGEAIFNRPEVGCADCHDPNNAYTDTERHVVKGSIATRTPTLLGIAASGPYFHDGTALTLRGVLEYSRDGSMGDTSSLSGEELDALEAYLRSL